MGETAIAGASPGVPTWISTGYMQATRLRESRTDMHTPR